MPRISADPRRRTAVTIAVDASGQAHVAGYTLSSDFPTAQAYQPVFGGGYYDGFVATLTSTGNSLVYSTFLGGSGSEMGPGAYIVGRDPVVSIAVTPSGDAYITGATSSTNFPTLRAVQPGHGGGEYDAFVAKYSAGGQLQWSTFLGGTGADFGKRIALDPTGGVVVAGLTSSSEFSDAQPAAGGQRRIGRRVPRANRRRRRPGRFHAPDDDDRIVGERWTCRVVPVERRGDARRDRSGLTGAGWRSSTTRLATRRSSAM